MELEAALKSILPSWLFDYFDLISLEDGEERLDFYFDEKKVLPSAYFKESIISYGFTPAYVVQDFPIRGKEVYLHLRRRKWLLTNTKEIVSNAYEVAHKGTQLTKEFVAFLKATN